MPLWRIKNQLPGSIFLMRHRDILLCDPTSVRTPLAEGCSVSGRRGSLACFQGLQIKVYIITYRVSKISFCHFIWQNLILNTLYNSVSLLALTMVYFLEFSSCITVDQMGAIEKREFQSLESINFLISCFISFLVIICIPYFCVFSFKNGGSYNLPVGRTIPQTCK